MNLRLGWLGSRLCREPVISLDWLPMLVHAAGSSLPKDLVIDGLDPTAVLEKGASSPHKSLFFAFRKYSAVRSGRYKLLRTAPDEPFALYDLDRDPGETRNIAEAHPEVVARLSEENRRWLVDCRERK